MSILQTENLTKIYGDGENAVHALRGINLAVEKGEFTAIVGTSEAESPRCFICSADWIVPQPVK